MRKTAAAPALALLLACCLAFGSAASGILPDFTLTREAWNAGWAENGNVNTNACLTPGSDETRLNFAWHSAPEAGTPQVRLSRSPDMAGAVIFTGTSAPADNGFVTCRVTATGIEPGGVYYYAYGAGRRLYGPFVYRSPAPGPLTFLYVNDLHAGFDPADDTVGRDKAYKIHSVFAEAVGKNPDAAFIVAGGDQTDSGQRAEEWNALLATPVLRSMPIAFAIGNHDKKGVMQKYYLNNPNEFDAALPSPVGKTYWFRYGDVLFLMFDSTNANATDHIRFAEEAVNRNLDAKWRIGVLHNDMNGPSFGFLDLDNNLIRTVYTTIFDRADLDVVLIGHSHIYGRSHFLKGNRIVGSGFGTGAKDPDGTAYISMSAVNNVASATLPWQNVWTAKRCRDDITTYSVFRIAGDTLDFKAFYAGGGQCDRFQITKTDPGGRPFVKPAGIDFYKIVQFGGLIYALVDAANRAQN